SKWRERRDLVWGRRSALICAPRDVWIGALRSASWGKSFIEVARGEGAAPCKLHLQFLRRCALVQCCFSAVARQVRSDTTPYGGNSRELTTVNLQRSMQRALTFRLTRSSLCVEASLQRVLLSPS